MKLTYLFALAPLVLMLGCGQKSKPEESKKIEGTEGTVVSDGKSTALLITSRTTNQAGADVAEISLVSSDDKSTLMKGKMLLNGSVSGQPAVAEVTAVKIGTNVLKKVEGPKR